MKKLFQKYREVILYLIMGGATTLVSWGTYALGAKTFSWSITGANVFSWICAVLFAFVTNKIWVFESRSWAAGTAFPELVRFVSARLLTGALEWFGVPFLVHIGLDRELFGVKGMWAKIAVSVLVVILNYVFSKLLVFTKKADGEDSGAEN